MKIDFSLRRSIGRYSAKLFALILTLSLIALAAIQAGSGLYQGRESDEWRNEVHEVLRDTEESFARFRANRQEAQQARAQERARIADFTAELARATSALQQHVADLHPKQTNCQSCRKQVKELQALIKRIGQILN